MKCHDLLLYGLVGVNQHKTRLLYFFFFLFLTFSFFHKKQKEKKSTHKKQLHSTSTVFKIHLGFGVFPLPRRQCGSEIKRSPSTIQMWLVQNHPLRTFRLRRLFASWRLDSKVLIMFISRFMYNTKNSCRSQRWADKK